jgi:hypothetical protein
MAASAAIRGSCWSLRKSQRGGGWDAVLLEDYICYQGNPRRPRPAGPRPPGDGPLGRRRPMGRSRPYGGRSRPLGPSSQRGERLRLRSLAELPVQPGVRRSARSDLGEIDSPDRKRRGAGGPDATRAPAPGPEDRGFPSAKCRDELGATPRWSSRVLSGGSSSWNGAQFGADSGRQKPSRDRVGHMGWPLAAGRGEPAT